MNTKTIWVQKIGQLVIEIFVVYYDVFVKEKCYILSFLASPDAQEVMLVTDWLIRVNRLD